MNFDKYSIQKLNKQTLDGMVRFTFWHRDVVSNKSRNFGTMEIPLQDIVKMPDLTYKRQCPIRTSTGGVIVGRVLIKIELGCRALHFGSEYIDAVSLGKSMHESIPFIDELICSANYGKLYDNHGDHQVLFDHNLKMNDFIYKTCVHDEHTEQHSDKPTTPAGSDASSIQQQQQHPQQHRQSSSNRNGGSSSNLQNLNESPNNPDGVGDTLQGLFYIGQCSSLHTMGETFLICRPFWSNDILVTECYQSRCEDNCYLNYLEVRSNSVQIYCLVY